ncbi:MAG TPA: hypothetical protein PKA06_11380, partial [Gemmatales bacterium]|nr:hypothetical protein [Gemmatales bacterium]
AWLDNLEKGAEARKAWHQQPVESAGRCRFAGVPTLTTLLHAFGIKRTIHYSADGGIWPTWGHSLVGWRGPDGELLESCARKPEPIDQAETAFHLGHLFYDAGHSEYVSWLHLGILQGNLELPVWFRCWYALHELAPVFGPISPLERTIRDIPATELFTPVTGDDFQSDYLLELTGHADLPGELNPISRFSEAQREVRRCESLRTFHAMYAAITTQIEITKAGDTGSISLGIDENQLQQLAERLVRSSCTNSSGYIVVNPCSFARKV